MLFYTKFLVLNWQEVDVGFWNLVVQCSQEFYFEEIKKNNNIVLLFVILSLAPSCSTSCLSLEANCLA